MSQPEHPQPPYQPEHQQPAPYAQPDPYATQNVPVAPSGQTQAYPAANPGYGPAQPMSAPPMSGPPAQFGYPAQQAPQPPRTSRAVPVLAGVLGLALILGIVMTVLFVSKSSAYTKSQNDVAAKTKTISDSNTKIDDLNTKLAAANSTAETAKQQLTGSQNKAKELTTQNATLATCVKAVVDLFKVPTTDKPKFDAAFDVMDKACTTAGKIVG